MTPWLLSIGIVALVWWSFDLLIDFLVTLMDAIGTACEVKLDRDKILSALILLLCVVFLRYYLFHFWLGV